GPPRAAPAAAPAEAPPPARCARLPPPPFAPASAAAPAAARRLVRVGAAALERRRLEAARAAARAPSTPCAIRRCAPKPAARVNARPHSGQVNCCSLLACSAISTHTLSHLQCTKRGQPRFKHTR